MGSNAFTETSTLHEVGQQSNTAALFPERYSNTSPDSSDATNVKWQRFYINVFFTFEQWEEVMMCCPVSNCWITCNSTVCTGFSHHDGFQTPDSSQGYQGCLVMSSPQQHTALTHLKGMHNIGEKRFCFFSSSRTWHLIPFPPSQHLWSAGYEIDWHLR